LADLSNISSYNDGARYLLTCTDVFSKKAWAVPVRTKTGREVANAFEKIFLDGTSKVVQSDKVTEFLNSTFQGMLKRRGIKFYTSENEDLKASVVERFNRTLKSKMYRYFTHKNTRRYVDALDDMLHSYNNTRHRSIGMAPTEVDVENEDLVRKRLNSPKPKSYEWKYEVGDRVRHTMQKRPFRKGYLGDWSLEIFVIKSSTHRSRHVPTSGLGRRTYKRQVSRARTIEGLKVRRRTLPYRSHTQDKEAKRRSHRISRFVKGLPEQI